MYPDSLWTLVRAEMAADENRETRYTLPTFIGSLYPGDVAAELAALQQVRYRIEDDLFDLPAAIRLTESSIPVARRAGDRAFEGLAQFDLSRYYAALNYKELAATALDRAIALYETLDQPYEYDYARINRWLFQSQGNKDRMVVDRLRTLGDTASYPRSDRIRSLINRRLVFIGERLEDTTLIREATNYLQRSAAFNTDTTLAKIERALSIYGQALIARLQRRYPDAVALFGRSAALHEAVPDYWRTANAYLRQAEVAALLKRPTAAAGYLDRAEAIAGPRKLADLLAKVADQRTQLAVARQDYRSAFLFQQQKIEHEAELAARDQNFDLENHYLRTAKEQLESEQAAQAALLTAQRQRLTLWRLSVFLGIGVLVLLVYGLYYQRNARKKLAQQHAITEQQATELHIQEQARTRFFTNVSHELRTPLTLVLNPVRRLAAAVELPAEARQLLHTATRSGAELEDLIAQILDFDRLENGRIQPRLAATPLAAYLEQLLETFLPPAARKGVDYTYQLSKSLQLVAMIDRTLYRRMLGNLVTNAIKFTPRGGTVRVILTLQDEMLCIAVSDTGPGIAETDRTRIFERFYQSDSGRLSGKGSGIGLSMVKAYAKLLGGRVTLDTAWEKGARFVIHLPVKAANSVPAAAAEQRDAVVVPQIPKVVPKVADRPRILVVEDHPELQDYLRLLLEDDYTVDTADHGKDALALLAEDPAYALILTDLMMPVMDGFALLAALKADPELRTIPVVVLTARAGKDDRLQALRIGVDDYLTKPFRTERLFAVLTALLDNRTGRGNAVDDAALAPDPAEAPTEEQRWLTDFETYVEKHLTDHDFSVAALARSFAMSESTLLRTLRRLTGLTPARYVQEVRLARARRLLEDGTFTSVKAVADAVGYADGRSFSRAYRKRFGHLPSELLKPG